MRPVSLNTFRGRKAHNSSTMSKHHKPGIVIALQPWQSWTDPTNVYLELGASKEGCHPINSKVIIDASVSITTLSGLSVPGNCPQIYI